MTPPCDGGAHCITSPHRLRATGPVTPGEACFDLEIDGPSEALANRASRNWPYELLPNRIGSSPCSHGVTTSDTN